LRAQNDELEPRFYDRFGDLPRASHERNAVAERDKADVDFNRATHRCRLGIERRTLACFAERLEAIKRP